MNAVRALPCCLRAPAAVTIPRVQETFYFDGTRLDELARSRRNDFANAKPFPSIVLDGLLPDEVALRAAREFPAPHAGGFSQPDNPYQKGKRERIQQNGFVGVSPLLRHLLSEFNSMAFLEFLERLTGIEGLIPDPHFSGGALHQVLPGGRLAVHADFNLDTRRRLERRVNVLFYFNPDWDETYGGDLELWPQDMSGCTQKIPPLLNRCVIFATGKHTYHGHPDPLKCPEGRARNSMAFYYYTAVKNWDETKEHYTLWQRRPGQNDPADHTRHPGGVKLFLKRRAKAWLPPVLFRLLRS